MRKLFHFFLTEATENTEGFSVNSVSDICLLQNSAKISFFLTETTENAEGLSVISVFSVRAILSQTRPVGEHQRQALICESFSHRDHENTDGFSAISVFSVSAIFIDDATGRRTTPTH